MGRLLGGGKNPYGVGNAGPGWPLSLVARKTVSYQGSSLAQWWEGGGDRDCLPGASLRGRYEGNDDGRFSLVSFPTSISRDATPSLLAAGGGAISIHSSIIISKMGFVPSLCVCVCRWSRLSFSVVCSFVHRPSQFGEAGAHLAELGIGPRRWAW